LAISKAKKEELVAQYLEVLERSSAVILAESTGLTVKETEGLRAKIREMGGEFYVVKNTLAKRAFQESGWKEPDPGFDGPTAIGAASENIPGMAKAMVDLAKDKDTFRVKSAIIDGELYTAAQITNLAELPAMPVLQAQLLGVMTMPAAKLAGVFAASARQLLNVLQAYVDSQPDAATA
jgi:large subunit ribosomal protein L10